MYDVMPGAWDEPLPHRLGDESHSLLSFARCLVPRTTHLWTKARISLAHTENRWTRRHPEIEGRMYALQGRLEAHLRLALRSQRIVVRGIGWDGREMRVPQDRASRMYFDFVKNTAGFPDGPTWWDIRIAVPSCSTQGGADVAANAEVLHGAKQSPAKATQAQFDKWYVGHIDRCREKGLSPNINEDEKAAREFFGTKYDRAKLRNARQRLAPNDWKSRGKRRGKSRQTPVAV